jgi:hypothetical protein
MKTFQNINFIKGKGRRKFLCDFLLDVVRVQKFTWEEQEEEDEIKEKARKG